MAAQIGGLTNNIKQLTQQYIQLQNQIESLNKQATQLRTSKQQVENALIKHIKSAGLDNFGITYQGKKIYIGNEITYDNITFKFLEECLNKLYGNKAQVKQILDFVKAQRIARKSNSQVIKVGMARSNKAAIAK